MSTLVRHIFQCSGWKGVERNKEKILMIFRQFGIRKGNRVQDLWGCGRYWWRRRQGDSLHLLWVLRKGDMDPLMKWDWEGRRNRYSVRLQFPTWLRSTWHEMASFLRSMKASPTGIPPVFLRHPWGTTVDLAEANHSMYRRRYYEKNKGYVE